MTLAESWKIVGADGSSHAVESAEEAFRELPGHGKGAAVWKRREYRMAGKFTGSPEGWVEVKEPPEE